MITSDSMRGFNDLLILLILQESDNYGYEISKAISALAGDSYEIKEATLYSCFKRLEKNKLIESYDGEESFGRKRVYYRISKLGKEALDQKLAEFREIEELMKRFFKRYYEED